MLIFFSGSLFLRLFQVQAILILTAAAASGSSTLETSFDTDLEAVAAMCRMLEPRYRPVGPDGAFSIHTCAVRYVALLCSQFPSEALCDALVAGGLVDSLATMLVRELRGDGWILSFQFLVAAFHGLWVY